MMKIDFAVYVDVGRTAYGLADHPMSWNLAERIAETVANMIEDQTYVYDTLEDSVEMRVKREG